MEINPRLAIWFAKVIIKEVSVSGKRIIKYFIHANKIKESHGFKYIVLNDCTVVLESIF